MATTPKRGNIKNVTDEMWAEMYARFINNDVDYERILSPPLYQYLLHVSRRANTAIGFVLGSILVTVNFMLALKGAMISVKRTFHRNLNLFGSYNS